jgi:gamma-glutamyltranspeptidase/glutathione hydrolase
MIEVKMNRAKQPFSLSLGLAVLLLLPTFQATPQSAVAPAKFARSRHGMIATGSPYATTAAAQILASGGNAMDAAAAAHLALTVVDPANTSLGGRTQILLRLRDGRVIPIDGATQAPAGITALSGADDERRGYAVVPIPGNLSALAEMVGAYGKLKWADVLQPAIKLAEQGFKVPPRLAATWAKTREALRDNPGAAQNFLKPDGSAYRAGEVFRQPRLAQVLRQLATSGVEAFYRGPIADAIARDVERNGGFIRKKDLENYRAQPGVVVRTTYRGYEVAAAGGRGWGDTLVEMLNILDQFPIGRAAQTGQEVEILARVMGQALADRPQEIGSLKPKKDGYPLAILSSRLFGIERAALIKQQLLVANGPARQGEQHDTTHLSVMDTDGNAVALTTSIGPSFGSRMATPELGFLYAHSYRMRADPTPGSRDETEMTPTILLRDGKPVLAIGAAGSELIPTAILQIISNLVDRGHTLEEAFSAPRIFCLNRRLRVQVGFSAALSDYLRARGFELEQATPDSTFHFGLAQAVQYDPATGEYSGAADPQADGSAAGPDNSKDSTR